MNQLHMLPIVVVAFSTSVFAETDKLIQSLTQAGIKQQVIDILINNDLTAHEDLCKTSTKELTDIGVSLGQAKKIERFCGPEVVPVPVKVDFSTMSELDLLNRLAANIKDKAALATLRARDVIQSAEKRTNKWAVVVKDTSGKSVLDAVATWDYLQLLTGMVPGPVLTVTREGKAIESLDNLLVDVGQVLLHPLIDGECLIQGYDLSGLDWAKVPQDVMRALFWARITNNKEFIRMNMDVNQVYGEVAKNPIDNYFIQQILGDYQAAVKRGDRNAMDVNLVPTPQDLEECKKKD